MLSAASDGAASGLGPSLVTTLGLIIVAVIGLVGILYQFRNRGREGDDSPASVIVGLATTLSEEHDERIRLERELAEVSEHLERIASDLDACLIREHAREEPPS